MGTRARQAQRVPQATQAQRQVLNWALVQAAERRPRRRPPAPSSVSDVIMVPKSWDEVVEAVVYGRFVAVEDDFFTTLPRWYGWPVSASLGETAVFIDAVGAGGSFMATPADSVVFLPPAAAVSVLDDLAEASHQAELSETLFMYDKLVRNTLGWGPESETYHFELPDDVLDMSVDLVAAAKAIVASPPRA